MVPFRPIVWIFNWNFLHGFLQGLVLISALLVRQKKNRLFSSSIFIFILNILGNHFKLKIICFRLSFQRGITFHYSSFLCRAMFKNVPTARILGIYFSTVMVHLSNLQNAVTTHSALSAKQNRLRMCTNKNNEICVY